MSDHDDVPGSGFAIGYGKPPAEHRFRPGHSGNPKGRPRRPATFPGAFAAMLTTTAPTVINGKRCRKTVIELAVMRAMKDILTGNPRALERWIPHLERHAPAPPAASNEPSLDMSEVTDEQLRALASIRLRGEPMPRRTFKT